MTRRQIAAVIAMYAAALLACAIPVTTAAMR